MSFKKNGILPLQTKGACLCQPIGWSTAAMLGNPKTLTPVRGPPLRTGSADYLWTVPRTPPTDPLYGPPPKI